MADGLVINTYICKAKTQSACAKEFLNVHPELKYVEVEGDGNCFFRSLAAYYKLHPELSIDGIHNPTNFNELRQYIVYRFGQQINEDDELRNIFLPALNERPIEIILSELATTCIWNVPVFEMMIERVSTILNINLRLYRINRQQGTPLTVTESFYTPSPGLIADTTISVFLASNHYGLIIPTGNVHGMPVVAAKKKPSKTMKKSAANKKEQENINAAINASMYNYEMAAFKQQMNNAKFAEELQQLQISNKKNISKKQKKPKVGVLPIIAQNVVHNVAPNSYHSNSSFISNASLASSVGSFNGFNIENAKKQYPYGKTKATEIKEMLDAYGIEYPSKASKETLYGEFLMAFVANINERTRVTLQSKKHSVKQNKKVTSRKAARNARRASIKK